MACSGYSTRWDGKMKTKTQARLENILLPIAKRLNINPNMLTILSVIFTLAASYYILRFDLIPAALLFLVGAVLDALDGLVARAHKRETKFGAFLDQTADRVNDGAVIIAIILTGYVDPLIGVSALFFVLLSSYMSAVIDSLTAKRIGEAISFRPIRSAAVFLGLLTGQMVALIWVLLFIGLWTIVYRMFKAKMVL